MSRDNPQRRRFLVVHNPLAGWGRHALVDQVRAHLEAAGAVVRIAPAESFAASARLVAEVRKTDAFDAVIAAGGDSTIRGLAAELAGTPMPLGIIPVGTGNVLAEEIGLKRTAGDIADCLLHGPCLEVRPGLANGQRFLSMASAGFDVGVLQRLDVAWKRRVGKLAYVRPVLRELMRAPVWFDVEVDGKAYACTWIVITKTAHYAGAFVIAPRQSPWLCGFHAVIVDASSRLALSSVLVAAASGQLARHPSIKILACREVTIPRADHVPFQIDGEPIDCGASITIRSDRQTLRLIVPSGTRSRSAV